MKDLGTNLQSGSFRVWAPLQTNLKLKLNDRLYAMEPEGNGYFHFTFDSLKEGDRYTYVLESGLERPDPVSRFLPDGPFGTSCVEDSNYPWTDDKWVKPQKKELIFYECHVGTFTNEGTFRGVIEKLGYLKELGITCLELMPVAEFSGRWGWGYDSVSPFAPHHHYGTPGELKELINQCHNLGIAVCLDVVYNHFGPEGCFLQDFGPYFTDRYMTPWGQAINFDGPQCDGVRNFFIQNALYWIREFHVEALRLDALHGIFDNSPNHFLKELAQAVNKEAYLIGESDLNDSGLILNHGLDALWNEDFHHALHVTLTGERQGYYQDFKGIDDLKTIFREGIVYGNKYSAFRERAHGNSFKKVALDQHVGFAQNHDQVGNRVKADRLSATLSLDLQKVVAFIVLLGPFLPLIFMGEEYGEKNSFEYFVDCQDKNLFSSICEGRKREFQIQNISLPDENAFLRSRLSWEKNDELLSIYKQLIALRKKYPPKEVQLLQSEDLQWQYGDNLGLYCSFQDKAGKVSLVKEILFQTKSASFKEGMISYQGPYAVLFKKGG